MMMNTHDAVPARSFSLPEIAASFFLALTPFLRFSWDYLTQAFVAGALLLITGVFAWVRPSSFRSIRNLPLILFFLTAMASSYFSRNPGAARAELIVLLAGCCMLVSAEQLSPAAVHRILRIPLLAGIWFTGLLIALHLSAFGVIPDFSPVIHAYIINPNILAGYLTLCFPLTFIRRPATAGTSYDWAAAAVSLTLFVGIVLSQSRAAVITAIIMAGIAISRHKRYRRWILPAAFLMSVLVFCFVDASTTLQSIYERYIWAKTAWLMFLNHPIIGVGWGNFSTSFLAYRPELIQNSLYAHNVFVQVLAETGIVGFSAFAFFLYMVFMSPALPDKNLNHAIRHALAGFLIVNSVDYSFYIMGPQMLFLFFCGISVSARPAVSAKPGAHAWVTILTCACLLAPIGMASRGMRLAGQGAAAFRSGNNAAALPLLQKAVKTDPLPAAPYEKLAELSFASFNHSADLKALDSAIGYQKEAIRRNKASAAAWSDLAWLYWMRESRAEARNAIARAVLLDRHNIRYRTTLQYFTDNPAPENHEKK